ncbi:Collagenase [Eumeta japonica]|uniref:Collagenase n=1 Tax=Eumeta variegata TaxID=151549 RepID=A0A4C1U7H4_EUMVA|nr:Collagenase [Eumeta japonica]
MRPEVLLLLGMLAAVGANVVVKGAYNYHELVGIPDAKKIRKKEEKKYSDSDATLMDVAPPFLAGLVIDLKNRECKSICGASLLNTKHLVTAAHCWRDTHNQAVRFTVVLGSQFLFRGGIRISTNKVVTHPDYIPTELFIHDIAMIYLPTDTSTLTEFDLQPVALPNSDQSSQTYVDEWAIAAGYESQPTNSSRVQMSLQVVKCHGGQDSGICARAENGGSIKLGYSGGPFYLTENLQAVLECERLVPKLGTEYLYIGQRGPTLQSRTRQLWEVKKAKMPLLSEWLAALFKICFSSPSPGDNAVVDKKLANEMIDYF